ncbi:MAG: class I SAM-dependent RNA methyltransferase [Synechococcaceae cyanobacterium]|nr:class I SAM-dependent RNA methyltransferase [Synechococcaceae cyanobacterium]
MSRSIPTAARFAVTAVVPPGLEEPAAAELLALGATEVQPLRRAVACRTDLAGFYRLHLQARLPFRVLRELARFPCRNRRELRQGVQTAADWDLWLPPQLSFRVDASGSLPELNHSHYTALEVKNALVDLQRQRWGERSSVDLQEPDLCLHLHLSPSGGGLAILSLAGGGPGGSAAGPGGGGSLHRRGYRSAMGLAPLKENLAAGLIALSGWDGTVPLLDPLCGSGTLLLEAAAMALGQAPGLEPAGHHSPGTPPRARPFGCRRWPDFEAGLWSREVEAAAGLRRHGLSDGRPMAPILGLERDPQVLEQARANAAAAGLTDQVTLQQGDFRDLVPPPGPGLLVCNPPYGVRLGADDDLEALYADLGRVLRERCGGWTLWLLSGNPALTGALRLRASRRVSVSNGGIDCRWLRYDLR